MRLAALLAVVAACGGNPSAPRVTDASGTPGDVDAPVGVVVDAGPDGAPGPPGPDGGVGVDAQTWAGVLCGVAPTAVCLAPDPVCCDTTSADRCVTRQAGCAGDRVQCDGPEDCGGGLVCCYLQGTGAVCTEPGMCGGPDEIMCHPGGPTACGAGQHCCPLGAGAASTPWGVCRTGTCPA